MPRLSPQRLVGATCLERMMTDWAEAGRKADAHRVRDLYRAAFGGSSKNVVRQRVIETLAAAGATTVLDLWGGGLSARQMTKAGLRVISVDNGGLDLEDRGSPVKVSRKRAALERTAAEDGYEARWGRAAKFAHEADAAFLDFCGPWSSDVRRTIEACRHMKAIVVTLMADHDLYTGATTPAERVAAYGLWLRMAFRPFGGVARAAARTPGRLLAKYKRPGGQPVFVFLVATNRIPIRHHTARERRLMDPAYSARELERERRRMTDPEYRARRLAYGAEYRRNKRANDPAYVERTRAANRASYAKRKAHLSSV